jgi:hypothetical protein
VLLKGATHLTATSATTTHASAFVAVNDIINKIEEAFEVRTEAYVDRS